jgi:chitinase
MPHRFFLRCATAVVAIALISAHLCAGASAATNLLTNPGFETGSLSGWSCDVGTAQVATSPVHSGTYALAGTPTSSANAQCVQKVSVQPNSSYTLSGWVEGSYVYIGVTGTGTNDTSNWTPSATTWQQLSTSFTTGASTTSVSVYVHGWYVQPTYYADDMSLTGPAGGGGGTGVPTAPTGLTVTGTTSSSVSLAWNAVSGATGYNIYQNGAKVTSTSSTSTTVTGLAASTTYTFTVTATNAAGESPESTAVQATTTAGSGSGGGGGGSLPKHLLTGYWQDFTNGAKPLKLSDVPTSYDLIAVAFANADPNTPGGVTFSVDSGLSSALGGYTDAQFTSDIATLHGRGQKVILSVGGQNGTVTVGDSTAAANFANSVYAIMQKYGFDGVDIDLENGLNATYMGSALQQLSGKTGPNLIITLAPQTIDMQSTSGSYFKLALNIKSILTIVNMQYYNSGSMNGCDGKVYSEGSVDFLTALACIQLQNGLRPDQVGLGLPASSQAAGSGYVSPAAVNNALDCLASGTNCGSFKPPATWPSIRGAMTWSISWDGSNNYNFANTVKSHLETLP